MQRAIHIEDCNKECGGIYVCPGCIRVCGWCFGGSDSQSDFCDDCAVKRFKKEDKKNKNERQKKKASF